jgi:hypothetical protein
MRSVTIDLVVAQLAFYASTALPNDFPSWLSVRPSISALGNSRLPPRSAGHYKRRLRKAVDFMSLNRPSGSSVQLIPKTTLNNYPEPAASTSRPHSMFE